MREGSDQIALLHGEGFCKPRGIRTTVPSLVTIDGCYGQCRSKLQSLCIIYMEQWRKPEKSCFSKQSLHTCQQTVTASFRLYNFTTFKRKRPSTKISNAFKIAEIYHSCLSRAILKITWFSLKRKMKWKTCSGITSETNHTLKCNWFWGVCCKRLQKITTLV